MKELNQDMICVVNEIILQSKLNMNVEDER